MSSNIIMWEAMKTLQPPKLTVREREVAVQVARGLSNKEIARNLGISDGTVKLHVHHILAKKRLRKRYQLIHSMLNGGSVYGGRR